MWKNILFIPRISKTQKTSAWKFFQAPLSFRKEKENHGRKPRDRCIVISKYICKFKIVETGETCEKMFSNLHKLNIHMEEANHKNWTMEKK